MSPSNGPSMISRPILALAAASFGIGTTEFVIMGLLPDVAGSLHVSIPQAGYLVSGYAMGVVVGTIGPGQWSIDGHVSALQNLWGWPGFGISLGAGALGAAGLLAVYWRPEKPAEADKA